MDCVRVGDFKPEWGWTKPEQGPARTRWCCEQLEEGRVLLLDTIPFDLPESAREFLRSSGRFNLPGKAPITFTPETQTLQAFRGATHYQHDRMTEILRHCSQYISEFLAQLLSPYAHYWTEGDVTFRPHSEGHRELPLQRRDDLLHVDALAALPTAGARILRCFSNLHPTQSQVWCTTESFPEVATQFAADCGLNRFALQEPPAGERLTTALKRTLGMSSPVRTPYERFMWRFNGYLKQNTSFQACAPKFGMIFPPNSTWVCFTDAFPHAMLESQFALEQTLLVPVHAMLAPEKSPLRILEGLAEHPLTSSGRGRSISKYPVPATRPVTARP